MRTHAGMGPTATRILVVGSGAREHALAWRLAREPRVERVICAPGNPLMADVAVLRPEVQADEIAGVVALARRESVDLVVVGPEAPLVSGLADALDEAGVPVFGPTARAARIEGSKGFCREISGAAGVAMARGRATRDVSEAIRAAEAFDGRVVVKADGLAAGKGVVVCDDLAEAEAAIRQMLVERAFGQAGGALVVEERLAGDEVSVIAITDGTTALALPPARDHKRLGEDDTGPNTGGMGAISPVAGLDDDFLRECLSTIHEPVLAELRRRGSSFRGALYAGLMLTPEGPRLLEFNARFGDPEAQAILPRLDLPLASLLLAAATGGLARAAEALGIDGPVLPVTAEATVAVVIAAPGYPAAPQVGGVVDGLDEAVATGGLVFGAGLRREASERLVTAGGRVVTVVGRGPGIGEAAEAAYGTAEPIRFDGRQLRRDIGRGRHVLVGAAGAR